jgi:hypothetical protein
MKDIERDRRSRLAGQPSRRVDPYCIMLSDPETERYHKLLELKYPERKFDLPLAAVDCILRFKPVDHVDRLVPSPLLIVGLVDDWLVSIDQSRELYARAKGPSQLMLLDNIHYHDIYHEPTLTKIMGAALAWHASSTPSRFGAEGVLGAGR